MPDPNHETLRRLFDRALELPPAARATFLESKCGDDLALKKRLQAMLAALEDENFLAEPTAGSFGDAAVDARLGAEARREQEQPGSHIGPYKLLQQLGEGGFGVVFLAEQEQPVARRVALKILKLGMDTRQVVARFEQERQALALMDHPNIARVLDAGATVLGRPYFVMDLVKGDPIVEYCDKHHLSIDDRLELFAQVCSAVQHAHGKGIIHRDIKPSNVLVGVQDGKAQAKVIDFGIAKATSHKLTDKTLFTEHQQVIGTLQYMSPEQAEGSLDIDTRTDVYSLGVMLYELLTGSTPFDKKTIQGAMFGELQRLIRDVEPPRPSTRLSESHEALASIAACRRIEPKRLGGLIRGELDWIVMKALEKDRGRRYETANGLQQDIRRFLAGEAVTAAPPSASYRLRKVVRRHRGLVAAIAAVTVALLVGVVGFAWQARVAQDERDVAVRAQAAETEQRRIAEQQRLVAETQRTLADQQKAEAQRQQALAEANASAEQKARRRAEAIGDFVTKALQSSDPTTGGTQGMLVTEALQKSVVLLDEGRFRDEPDVEASLRSVIASIFNRNGKVTAALPLAQRSLAIYERIHPGDDKDVAAALDLVATIQQDLGQLAIAEPLFVRSLAMLRRLHADDHANVAKALNNLSLVRCYLGRQAEAEPLLAEALAMQQRLTPGDDADVAMNMNNLATLRDGLGLRKEAAALYETSLAMYERLFTTHPQLAMALLNLGNTRIPEGRLVEAEQLFDRALAMYRQLFPGDHPDVARALSASANIRKILGRGGEAEPLYEQALAMQQRLFPGDHQLVATMLAQLAQLRQELGRPADAEALYRQALAMQQALHPGDHPDVAQALDSLAAVLRDLKRDAEAGELLVAALAMHQRFFGAEHARVAKAMNRLAAVRGALGDQTAAEALARQALAMLRRLRTGDHPEVAVGLAYLASLLRDGGQLAEAETLYAESLQMCQRYYQRDHYDTAIAFANLAGVQHRLGKHAESRANFEAAIAMHERRTPQGGAVFAQALWQAGNALLEAGDAAAALPRLEAALAMGQQQLAAGHAKLATYRDTLQKCRAALGK